LARLFGDNANQTTRLREKQFGALLGIEVVQQFAGPCGMAFLLLILQLNKH
ncbi:hypothetical protein MKW98_029578, partial [Papaver atlanticum]